MPEEAFVGIDVAFAKEKRLPVCICTIRNARLFPLALRQQELPQPPRGKGNKLSIEADIVASFALQTLAYIQAIEKALDVRIMRIALDAPSAFKLPGRTRRAAEQAMDKRRISCFATPSRDEFDAIIVKVKQHLKAGGSESTIPHANQLWMLVGFTLFETLGKNYECIEVFPQATASVLGCSKVHKSKVDGLAAQFLSASKATGWSGGLGELDLESAVFGPPHDRLDAYLSAWIASLPESGRIGCGVPPDDAIWIPAPLKIC